MFFLLEILSNNTLINAKEFTQNEVVVTVRFACQFIGSNRIYLAREMVSYLDIFSK